MVTPDCFMASVDIKDAYYSVKIADHHLKYLSFMWEGRRFMYTAFPNASASCHPDFTKLLKPASIISEGRVFVCGVSRRFLSDLDDFYLQGESIQQCRDNVVHTVSLLRDLGFVTHPDKSMFESAQCVKFLVGF